MVAGQLQGRIGAVRRTHDVCRRQVESQEQGGEILRVQLRRIRLVVVYLWIGRMIAAAVDEDPIDLRELGLLSAPRPQIPQRAVDEYHRGSPAVADEAVRKSRAVERRGMECPIERAERSRLFRGPGFLRGRVSTAGGEN